jgi:DNA-binding MarR family transcriptional regulator
VNDDDYEMTFLTVAETVRPANSKVDIQVKSHAKIGIAHPSLDPASATGERLEPHTALEERVSLIVHRINSRFTQIANQLLQARDINMYDSRIMLFLLQQREMRVGELVEAMALPQSTISHQLMRLQARKLIRRRRSRKDNRSVAIMLTPAGEEIARDSEKFSLYVQRRINEHFSPPQMDQLNGMLNTVFELLEVSRFNPEDALGGAQSHPLAPQAAASVKKRPRPARRPGP